MSQWRRSVSLDYFAGIRAKFERAGIAIYGLQATPNPAGEDLDRIFEIARALGAAIVTLGGTMSLAKRLAPVAEKQKMIVGFLGRPNREAADPDQISTPENYDEVLSLSKNFSLCFDIGDATGAGYDTLGFVEKHHERIGVICLKDRGKDRVSKPWGEGDTPIRQILRTIRDRKYPIRCYVDCDYNGVDRVADIKRCFEYAKTALA